MKDIHAYLDYAREYLYCPVTATCPVKDCILHPTLQYWLCDGYDRLKRSFGEVTHKDVAMMVEAWVLAAGLEGKYKKGLYPKDERPSKIKHE